MKIIWKIIIIVIIIGLILSIVGFATGASRTLFFDRTGVHISGSGISHITEMNLSQIRNVSVDVGLSDVELVISGDFGIELYGSDIEWLWTLEEETLNISHSKNTRMQIINLDFITSERNYVKIFLPEDAVLDIVDIKTSSGDIKINNFRVDRLEVKSSFGDVDVNNITSNNLYVDLSSGRFTGASINTGRFTFTSRFGDGRFQSVTADSLKADSSSGSMQFTDCAFGEFNATSRFGSITTNGFAASKTNILANSGNVRINGDLSGETIIHTDFGDIKLVLSREKDEYSYDISVRFGSITFDGVRQRDQTTLTSGTSYTNHLKLSSSSGEVDVSFGG